MLRVRLVLKREPMPIRCVPCDVWYGKLAIQVGAEALQSVLLIDSYPELLDDK